MRRILLLVLLALIVGVMLFHQRIFLRDPFGTVHKAGAGQVGARVYINYTNDVLLQDENGMSPVLVQRGSVPGVPQRLTCLRGMLCLTEADLAPVLPLSRAAITSTTMSNRTVTFKDGEGNPVEVKIR